MSNVQLLDLPLLPIQSSDTPFLHASDSSNEPEGVQRPEEQDLIQRTTLIIDSLSGDMKKDLPVIREKLVPLILQMEGALRKEFSQCVAPDRLN